MTRIESPAAVDTRRVMLFLSVLVALVAGFTAIAWYTTIDILALGPVYMFTPAIAGLVVCLRNGISLGDAGVRVGRRRWLVISAVIWPPIALCIALISSSVPGISLDPTVIAAETGVPLDPLWLTVGSIGLVGIMVLTGATINAVIAFGEEFGWRGYLLWELAPLGFWKASLVIGTVWGLWHAPLIIAGLNYPSFPYVGIVAFTIACIALSPLLTYIVVRSGSVIPAAVFHGVFNATGLVGLATTDSAILRELVASEGGVVGLSVFALIAAGIAITGTPYLTREFANHVRRNESGEPMREVDTRDEAGPVGER